MTDEEIKKALECCAADNCDECPLFDFPKLIADCMPELLKSAFYLINGQQAEIKRLEKDLIKCKLEKEMLHQTVSEIQTNAIKEFAERLKEEIIYDTAYGCDCNQHSGYYDYKMKIGDIPEYIDDIVKKLTEGGVNNG